MLVELFEKERLEPLKLRAVERLKNKNADTTNRDMVNLEIRQILTEEEGGVFQYLQRMRPKMLLNAQKAVQDRINVINNKDPKDIDAYEKEELQNLQGILTDLKDNENASGDL